MRRLYYQRGAKMGCFSENSKTMMMKPSDVSLSLWSYNNSATAPTYPFRPAKEAVVSSRASKCISSFYKWEDPYPLHQLPHHHHEITILNLVQLLSSQQKHQSPQQRPKPKQPNVISTKDKIKLLFMMNSA